VDVEPWEEQGGEQVGEDEECGEGPRGEGAEQASEELSAEVAERPFDLSDEGAGFAEQLVFVLIVGGQRAGWDLEEAGERAVTAESGACTGREGIQGLPGLIEFGLEGCEGLVGMLAGGVAVAGCLEEVALEPEDFAGLTGGDEYELMLFGRLAGVTESGVAMVTPGLGGLFEGAELCGGLGEGLGESICEILAGALELAVELLGFLGEPVFERF
jgi:hypothetical protein